MQVEPAEIIEFWRAAGPARWFAKNADFDDQIRARFEAAHHAAARGELDHWIDSAEGALALLLLLDQFPRNLWRGSPHAFATDPSARRVARKAIEAGHDRADRGDLRSFFYLPFSHSESAADQAFGMGLWEALERETGEDAKSARRVRDVIARFGRFPHRNRVLGRETTEAEQAFLDGGGFAG
jgi:uncharacterized protein (DUF924 family)